MNTVLVVDDMAIIRDPISASLKLAGYRTVCACNGQEALAAVQGESPQLVLLDLAMPVMDGLTFLRALRSDPRTTSLPVILLTALSDKQSVAEAAKLGVRDYLLKSGFSLKDLLQRVGRYTAPGAKPMPANSRDLAPATALNQSASQSPSPATAKQPTAVATTTRSPAPALTIPKLLTQAECVRRAEKAMEAKTLSGVVMQVIALAASPRGDMAELATLTSQDPLLSTRVLQAANSAAYACSRGVISTIPEAVRNIGCSTIRNIAAALCVFDAMPQTSADGFNPLGCWQHSIAVATLCERLVAASHPEMAGTAYLVGLCHDLGDILFHTHFAKEYQQVLQMQEQTGKPRSELENAMLGMTHGELVLTILRCVGLPESIQRPIETFHNAMEGRYPEGKEPLGRVLRLAELYANGMLLASSASSLVAPLRRADCRNLTGQEHPTPPDSKQFRSQILTLTVMLARLSPTDEARLMVPLYRPTKIRIYFARESAFSCFDPIAAAFESLANTQVHDRLPDPSSLAGYQAIVILTQKASAVNFEGSAFAEALANWRASGTKVLWLSPSPQNPVDPALPLRPVSYPTTLRVLAEFVRDTSESAAST